MQKKLTDRDRRLAEASDSMHRKRLGIQSDREPDEIGEILLRLAKLENEVKQLKRLQS